MGSLTGCIAQAGNALRPEDREAILRRAANLQHTGTEVALAARQAIDEQLSAVKALLMGHAESQYKRLQAAAAAARLMGGPGVSEPDKPYGDTSPAPQLTREQEAQVLPIISAMMEAAVDEGLTSFPDVASRTLADFKEMVPGPFSDSLTIQHLQGAYISLSSRYSAHGLDGIMAVAAFKSRADLAPKEIPDVPDRSPPVEPNRPPSAKPGVAPQDGDGSGAVEPGSGSAGRGTAGGGGRSGRGTRVHRDRPAVPGEGGSTGIPEDAPTVDGVDPQSGDSQGRSDARDLGAAPEPEPDQETLDFADRATPVSGDKARAQREAEKIPVIPGDADNIAATLPILLPLQQTDVLFAEDRFAKEDGYGVLFTNGTGTGKTFVGLGVVKRFVKQGKKNILIVAPSAEVINGWVKSAPMLGLTVKRLTNTKNAGSGVVITTYANLRANASLISRKWDLLLSDEAQNLNQNADGDPTGAAENFRALTMHPNSARARTRMLYPDLAAELDLIAKELAKATKAKNQAMQRLLEARVAPLRTKFFAHQDEQQSVIDANQGHARPRALFLSATPFAYEKSIRWAQHYLFDWNQGHVESGADNAGGAYEQFMMRHLGYQMRGGLLNEPDERRVDRGLLQRNFNTWLKQSGALAGRMLEVEPDYDRKFIAAQSGIGVRIDQGFSWFHDTDPATLGNIPVDEAIETPEGKLQAVRNAMSNVREALNKRFDYHTRMRLLEALKAEAAVPYIQAQMDLGRKVIVFHDLIKGQTHDPFGVQFDPEKNPTEDAVMSRWKAEFSDLVERNWNALKSPIETMMENFSPNVALLNGTVNGPNRAKNLDRFNSDEQGPMVLVVQSALEAGWSGHDTTGQHPRVLVNLGLPVTPTRSIQQEGRIYRVGQQSNAMFRYLNTQTNWEMQAFANTIARRASTAENLAMGEDARGLLASYVEAFEQTDDWEPGHEGEGTGGKARDRQLRVAPTDWDKAKTLYWSKVAKTAKNKAQEGADWFATPEPLGLKMAQWGDIRPDEQTLEPSAGDGAIARWMPDSAKRTAIEPSPRLAPRLALVFDGTIRNGTFEQLHVTNKADVVLMNPPFGKGGKVAIEHLAKAFNDHLEIGGRVVSLIPEGPATEARLDKFLNGSHQVEIPPRVLFRASAGPVYKGDTLTWNVFGRAGQDQSGVVVTRNSDGRVTARKDGIDSTFWESQITGVTPGPRKASTATVLNSQGSHVVATIKLPADTFGRAGTQVMTRIVIIDKLGQGEETGPARVDYDFSGLKTVEELFDAIENLQMPERTKQREVESDNDTAPAPVGGQTGAVDVEVDKEPASKARDTKEERTNTGRQIAQDFGLTITPWTTGKGNQLEGVILNHVTLAQAKEFDKFAWLMKGGVYTRIWELNDLLKKYPLPHVAQEERAVYAVREPDSNYDLDLFGDPIPQAAGNAGAPRRRAGVRRDVPTANTVSVRADPQYPGVYRVSTQNVEVGHRDLPVSQVTNWDEAAAALSALARFSVEHFDALVTDKNGKPLALIGGFKGALAESAVYPGTLLLEAMRIEGAHAAWGVHNHPSGMVELSIADRQLNQHIEGLFSPSRVKWMGLAAVGHDGTTLRYSAVMPGNPRGISNIVIDVPTSTMRVPIVSRVIVPDGAPRQPAIDNPALAQVEVKRLLAADGRPGIVFLNAQSVPQAWVPIVDAGQMTRLRDTGHYDKLLNSAANAGAGSAIISNPGGVLSDAALRNMASALSPIGVRLLDVIDPTTGTSAAQTGSMPASNLPVMSGITDSVVPGGVPVKDLQAAVTAATAHWIKYGFGPMVVVVATAADLPESIQAQLRSQNSLNTARGLIMPDGRVFLIADRLNSVAEGLVTLFHETYGHYGLRAFLDAYYEAQMALLRMANPKLAAEANAWYAQHGQNEINARIKDGMQPERAGAVVRALAIEEALSDRAGQNTPPKGWKLLLARLMKSLRAMGLEKVANWLEAKTEAETHALLMNARAVVVGDRAHANTVSESVAGEPAFSKVTSIRTGRIRRTVAELTKMAEDNASWKDWYAMHKTVIEDLFGRDADLFQKILSATSQMQTVPGNVTMAMRAYVLMVQGKEFKGFLPAVAKNLERIRAGENLNGPKISEFERGNLGAEDAIAVDRHIAQLLFNTSTPNRAQIEASKQRIRLIASQLGWTPTQVQASLWAANQVRNGTDPAKVQNYASVLEKRSEAVRAIRSEIGRGDGGSLQPGSPAAEGAGVGPGGRFDAREPDGPVYGGEKPLLSRRTPAALKPSTAWIDRGFRVGMAPVAKLTSPAYAGAINLADGLLSAVPGGYWEYIKAGIVDQYGLDPLHAEAKIAMQTAIRVNARKTGEIVDKLRVLDASQSRIAYLWASTKTEDAAAARALFDQLPEEPRAILQSLRDDIVHLGHEAVALGLISEEVRAANEFSYMHRSYEKYALEDKNAKAVRQRSISIIADEFKSRGMRDDAKMSQIGNPDFWARKTNGTASDPSLKGREFHRLELRAMPDTDTPQLFKDENGKPMGKIREIAYWPVDEPIPAKYADWRNEGTWKARWFNKAGKVGMFRDFTLAERTKMGEIQEIKYSTAVTMLQMVRDVETARFLDWVARNESLLDASQLPAGAKTVDAYNTLLRSYTKDEWVQVPDGKIKGTDVKRFANLAGRWVPGPVWNDIRQISQLNAQDEMTQAFNKLMRLWKISKTALSPVTHMNNVMSNFMIADMHDLQARHIYLALKAWTWGRKDPAMKRLLEDYQDNGGDAGKFNEAEIRNELFEPLLEELRQQIKQEAGGVSANMTAASVIDLLQHRQFRQALGAIGKTTVGRGAAWVPKKLMKLYGAEDEVFRLAAFIKARQDGLSDHDAGKFARDSFLNYDITAPWISAMRRTGWPFFAFMYRAAPMMLKLAADKPHKLAKYWALGGVLNTMAYGMGSGLAYFSFGLLGGGGDEDEERAYMPDDKSGRIWGFLGPKLIRMPLDDKNGNPVFLDVRRWIPAGDIVDTGQTHTMLPIPPPLVPTGPLGMMIEFASNTSGFTGKPIVDTENDTAMEMAGKTADWAWKAIMPNNPIIPFTYSQQNLIETMNGRVAPGTSGDEKASLAQAALSTFGVKVGSYPTETLLRNEVLKTKAQDMRINQALTSGLRSIQNGGDGVSEEDKAAASQKLIERAMEKITKRSNDLAAKQERAGR